MLKRAFAFAVVVVLIGQSAFANNLLKEYGEFLTGRWVGDVKLIADWPGTGKQGEKVVGHMTVRWIADRKGLESEWIGGNGAGKSIYMWDADAKKIKEVGVDSGGTTFQWHLWKKDGKWVFKGGGRLVDGKKYTGKGTVEILGADKFAYKGTFYMDGEKLLDLNDVYERASR